MYKLLLQLLLVGNDHIVHLVGNGIGGAANGAFGASMSKYNYAFTLFLRQWLLWCLLLWFGICSNDGVCNSLHSVTHLLVWWRQIDWKKISHQEMFFSKQHRFPHICQLVLVAALLVSLKLLRRQPNVRQCKHGSANIFWQVSSTTVILNWFCMANSMFKTNTMEH